MINWNISNSRVLLVDGDSTIPNLAIMKMASHFKQNDNTVDFIQAGVPYYPNRRTKIIEVDTHGYDLALCSVIFFGASDFITGDGLVFGGTGFDIQSNMPNTILNQPTDYSMYPDNDISYGFITRGCSRKCYFCVVPQKEGKTKTVDNISNIIEHKKVKFLDNNILSSPEHPEILRALVDLQVRCQFMQGLDVRYVDKINSPLLRDLNYMGNYIFAFDDWKYRREIERRVVFLKWATPWRLKFYVYVSNHLKISDHINRILWLKERQMLPYVMRDVNCWGSENQDFYTDIAAWCNQPSIFKHMDFYTFLTRRHVRSRDPNRVSRSAEIYSKCVK